MEEGERAVQLASLGVENVVLPGAEAAVQSGQAALQAGSAFVSVTADTGEHVAALAGEGGAATVAVGQEALTTAAQIGLAAVTRGKVPWSSPPKWAQTSRSPRRMQSFVPKR